MASEPIVVLLRVVAILDTLCVPYAIGGSVASGIFGEPRASEDADLVAELNPEHERALLEALRPEFYVPEEALRYALSHRSSFNIIHLKTIRKVDIFVAGDRPLDRSQITRRRFERFAEDPDCQAYVVSAEDIILVKLDWFRRGGCVSDRQWRDIRGVLKVQGARLDSAYLRRMAKLAGVVDLLERALAEAGLQE